MLVYAVRMRFDLEFPLFKLLGSARDTVGWKIHNTKKVSLSGFISKHDRACIKIKKMKFQDSKFGVRQNFGETPVIMSRLDNVASRTKKVSNWE